MADIAIFRINYKSDFILTLHSDAGWATPFCIKFWTGAPSQAYYAGWDGTTYTNCAADSEDPTKLTVQFDDHHLPIGDLKFQIGYHFTVADFPTSIEDEVINQAAVIIEVDDTPTQVMLDFNGETAPEIEFNLPAYAAEAARQKAEEERERVFAEKVAEMDSIMQSADVATKEAEQSATRADAAAERTNTAITETEEATRNAKADYIGEDSYVYHWSIAKQRYVKTDIYVRGKDGKSAYEQAQEGGYEGTEDDFLEMLDKCAEYGGVLIGVDNIKTFEELNVQNIPAGTFCMYQGKLYRFTIEHEANTEWNPAQVYETNLFKEIDNMIRSDYEEVVITLQTEDGVPLAGVEVVVKVEGEDSGRNLITDNEGKCSTQVGKGLEYTVECANVPNYYPVDTVVRRASLPVRYINFTYVEDDTLTRETVKITLSYADGTLPKATWVRAYYDGENHQLAVVDNVAETSIKIGTQYTISFEDIDGYKTPATQTFTASLHGTRNINVRYNAPVDGVRWLMKNGAERELNDVTNQERLNGDIFGLIVQTSDLMAAGCSFVIPLAFLLTQSATGTGQWLSSNVTVPHLNYFGSQAAALADFDGQANCLAIKQFIAEEAEQGRNYSSSMVDNCMNRVGGAGAFKDTENYEVGDYVVYRNKLHVFTVAHSAGAWVDGETNEMYGYIMPDGVVRRCFSPAYAQIYAFRLLRDRVNGFTTDVFGIGCCAIASGGWWTSTQYNAGNGVSMYNGGFNLSIKNGNYTLLPVLAY